MVPVARHNTAIRAVSASVYRTLSSDAARSLLATAFWHCRTARGSRTTLMALPLLTQPRASASLPLPLHVPLWRSLFISSRA